jgi:cytoskeletal protein CcmA (bactofilin family)
MLFNRKTESDADRSRDQVSEPADPQVVVRKTAGARPQSAIDETLAIVGDLRTDGDLRLDGHICGNVECAQLILGPKAAITGVVTAEQAIIRGRITGAIRAHVVVLQGSAHVDSDIVYGTLAIDEGAEFQGAVRRSDNPREDHEAGALAELKRMLPGPADAKAAGAGEPSGRPGAVQVQPHAGETAVAVAGGRRPDR